MSDRLYRVFRFLSSGGVSLLVKDDGPPRIADLESQLRSLTEENERLKMALSMIADEDGSGEFAVPSGGWPAWAQNLAYEALSPIDPPLAPKEKT